MKVTIAYIEQNFPGLTTTFIYREVFALQKLGFEVITFSVNSVPREELSAEAHPLLDSTYSIRGTPWRKIAQAHLYFIVTRPLAYLATLFLVTAKINGSFTDRRRTLLHFIGGVYFAEISKKKNIQHIHAHFSNLNATMAMVISKLLGISFSFTAHNICFWERILLPEKIKRAHFVLAISHYTRNFLIDQVPGCLRDHEKIHIVHCGVPVNQFTPQNITKSHQPLTILSVAQLAEHKGMVDLIQACLLLKQRQVPCICQIAGSGPQHNFLKQLIIEYMLQDQVQLLGRIFQEEIKTLLSQADIFAMACKHGDNGKVDGIPVALMEAMATGIPCVSTTVSGIPDLIDHGINGFLVEEQDITGIADSLESLLTNPEMRITMGNHARKKIVDEFNIDTTSAQVAALIKKYIGGNILNCS